MGKNMQKRLKTTALDACSCVSRLWFNAKSKQKNRCVSHFRVPYAVEQIVKKWKHRSDDAPLQQRSCPGRAC